MPFSMTAYGRATLQTSFGHLVVEVQSVNRKHLEIQIALPKELARFEADMRSWLVGRIHRGQVFVRVHATYAVKTPVKVIPNIPLARELKQAWDAIIQALGVNGGSNFHLEMLAHESELFSYESLNDEDPLYCEALIQTLNAALLPFLEMRAREGATLAADIQRRLLVIHDWIERVAERATLAPSRYREKLLAAIEQLLPQSDENADRVLREVCLYADRIDVAEEITRTRSHLGQLQMVLSSKQTQLGKTLEFLLQELFREVNTVASKSNDVEISHAVVDIKTEIERIREQVQNIE
jgi:uncharacterized protein (TIGR00255 family)